MYAAVAAVTVLAAAGCGDGVREPAIAFTYNWGDPPFERFLRAQLDATRPPGGDSIQLRVYTDGGWQALGASPLVGEVARATTISADSNVLAVVGPGGSREALQVAPVYAEAGLAAVIPTATSRLLADLGPLVFRVAPDDSVQGAFIAAFADTALRAKRLAIYHSPDEYGIGLAAGTRATAAARGMSVIAQTPIRLIQPCRTPSDDAYYETLVQSLASVGIPDAVVLAVRTQETGCLTRALRRRWPTVHVIAGDGSYVSEELFQTLEGRGEGLHLVAFWHPDIGTPAAAAFARDFTRIAGRAPRHGEAMFTDALLLVAQAIRSGARTRADVARYLSRVGTELPAYEGITGAISFAPGAQRQLWMTRIAGSSSVLVRQ